MKLSKILKKKIGNWIIQLSEIPIEMQSSRSRCNQILIIEFTFLLHPVRVQYLLFGDLAQLFLIAKHVQFVRTQNKLDLTAS